MIRNKAVLILLALVVLCGCKSASEPAGAWRPLFNGKDLSGWEIVGSGNWAVRDGAIVVSRRQGELTNGWLATVQEFQDFKLRLKFRSALPHFNSGVLFRDPGHGKVGRPAFNGFELQLLDDAAGKERNPGGSIYDLARAFPGKMKAGVWHDIEIDCIGNHIIAFVNGEKTAEIHSRRSFEGAIGLQLHGRRTPVEFWWKDIQIQELPPAPTRGKMLAERLENAPGEPVDFLAGKTLQADFDTYWDGGASWSLNNGVLRGEHPSEISWIFSKGIFADFLLSFDFRLSKGGNAGVCIRLPWPENGDTSTGPAFLGYECQIVDTGEVNPTGSIYGLARAYETDPWHRPIHKPGNWNHCRIYAMGDHLVTYVNRIKTAETHSGRSAAGRIGFQVHAPAKWVEYRNVRLKVIQQGAGIQ